VAVVPTVADLSISFINTYGDDPRIDSYIAAILPALIAIATLRHLRSLRLEFHQYIVLDPGDFAGLCQLPACQQRAMHFVYGRAVELDEVDGMFVALVERQPCLTAVTFIAPRLETIGHYYAAGRACRELQELTLSSASHMTWAPRRSPCFFRICDD
jgi:hypothetical protein